MPSLKLTVFHTLLSASWPLTPIEELDLYLESAADPGLIQLELPAGGHLDVPALTAALAGVLAADPAARRRGRHAAGARVQPAHRRKLR